MNKQFYYLVVGQSFANMGDVLLIMTVMSVIYQLSGKATAMAIIPLITVCGRTLSGGISPILFDKYGLKKLLVFSQFSKTIVLSILALISFTSQEPAIYVIYMVMFIQAFLDGWASPGRNGLIPLLVHKEKLLSSNSVVASFDQVIQLGGWAFGGVVVAFIGNSNSLLLIMILFLIGTIFMFMLSVREEKVERQGNTISASVKEGWMHIYQSHFLRYGTISQMLFQMAEGVWIAAIVYVFVQQVLHTSTEWWGYINAAFMLGLLISSTIFTKKNIQHPENYMLLGIIMLIVSTIGFGLGIQPWVSLIFSFLYGIFTQFIHLPYNTLVQSKTEVRVLGKVYAAMDMLTIGTFGLSTFMMGIISDYYGVQIAFYVSAGFLSLSGIFLSRALKAVKGDKNISFKM